MGLDVSRDKHSHLLFLADRRSPVRSIYISRHAAFFTVVLLLQYCVYYINISTVDLHVSFLII